MNYHPKLISHFRHYKGKPYRKICKVSHTIEGFDLFVEFLEVVMRETGKKQPIVLVATGHYHSSVVQYLADRGYLLIILIAVL